MDLKLKTKNDLQEILTLCDKEAKVRLEENNIYNDDRTQKELILYVQEIEKHLETQLYFKNQWKETAERWQKG